jgi:hypothetical protein
MVAGTAQAEADSENLVLVRDGRPACVIVTASTPSRPAAAAAAELQAYLKKASGAEVPVKKEDALTADERAGTLVVVGAAQLAAEAARKTVFFGRPRLVPLDPVFGARKDNSE